MVFSSMVFIFVFLPAVILLYFMFPWRTWRNTLLCVSSLVFYAWGEPVYILLMLFSVLLNYCAGLLINKIDLKTAYSQKKWVKRKKGKKNEKRSKKATAV